MIGYLNGTVLDIDSGVLTLVVAGGSIGYTVRVPEHAQAASLSPGKKIELHIYTHVREDVLDLYGFFSPEEKRIFLALTSVNGIGPKLGMTLISNLSVSEIISAIVGSKKEVLTAISGVGKKTAERMILELQEKFKKSFVCHITHRESAPSNNKTEITSILISLGYKTAETDRVIEQVLSENPNIENIEELIQLSLKLISNKNKRMEGTA
ncbi:MAG: Holliday junction branch migration protein RuvA [Xanthomonadaceae bacterium]|nr:Holliday junction branch migration protein RuvA [Xanthomonadaceae bacterium]